ncbi:MAG: DUF3179 domain-containing protein [Cellvibrionaceae bacterium]
MKLKHNILVFLVSVYATMSLALATTASANAEEPSAGVNKISQAFHTLLNTTSTTEISSAVSVIESQWQNAYVPQVLETIANSRNFIVFQGMINLLAEKTGENYGRNINEWYRWFWNQEESVTSDYANFKADIYKKIDPKFEKYFRDRQTSARIRLDEIRWGGVLQDGIPPLRNPEMISVKKARYLDDDNIVFGLEINGDARAYPKRILAWHEMFTDTVGGVDIAGVYCTLCGTIIPYKTKANGVKHRLGTSGFLYRSNKLMYDQATQSLWSTIKGEPVVGPLVDKGIKLEFLSIVTTTWGEWKKRHPDTTVLSLKTGHVRDYGEGVAYQDYFSNDRLMFNTPFNDDRLQNKQEVLALRFAASPKEQLAIDTDFLNATPLYKNKIGQQKFIVLTDKSGANRVYDPEGINFVSYDQDSTVIDAKGEHWLLKEDRLVKSNSNQHLKRLPYHRAFWFGWHAAFPETQLIK